MQPYTYENGKKVVSSVFTSPLSDDLATTVRSAWMQPKDLQADSFACTEREKTLVDKLDQGDSALKARVLSELKRLRPSYSVWKWEDLFSIFVKSESEPEYCLTAQGAHLAEQLGWELCPTE
jgi:hypothetical protein